MNVCRAQLKSIYNSSIRFLYKGVVAVNPKVELFQPSWMEEDLHNSPCVTATDAHVNLGIALSGIPGRMPEAIQHLKAALRIKPEPEIQQMLDRLEKPK